MKKLAAAVLALLLLVVLLLGGVWVYLRTSLPGTEGEIELSGLRERVEVWRDTLGVPHVWARSREDLLFAQGFVHAQDRLWQMELMRRVAQGRLAEVLGERALESDRFLRTVGLWHAAEAGTAALDAEALALVQAYVNGVNAFVRTRRGALPPEFVVLRVEFEPWTVQHVVAIEKVMAWDLTSFATGLNLLRAQQRLGLEKARLLAPQSLPGGATILTSAAPLPVPAIAASLLDALSAVRASNSWVVGGQRTRSGMPILANDMHLALRAPGVWYLMALHAPGIDVAGVTLPGAPFVVAGRNRAVAWGYTNAMVDDVDFFIEMRDPQDTTHYRVPGGTEPFAVRRERIRVKGRDTPVTLNVLQTRHGPVVSDVESDRAGGHLLALAWGGHLPARTFRGLMRLNTARDWDDFAAGIADFDNPHQNVVYADTSGRIGYWMAGRVPVRGTGLTPPTAPVPGWSGEWDWTGELPIDAHPHVVDPPTGYVVTANNRQAAGADAERITTEWMAPFRAMRIEQMITASDGLDASAVARQQMDVRDARAERYRGHAVDAARGARRESAAAALAGWDLEAKTGSHAAALFNVWMRELRRAAARDLYAAEEGWFPDNALHAMLDARSVAWVDAGGPARYDELAAAAMRSADSIVQGRSWGELHVLRIAHVLSGVPLLARLLRLDVGGGPADGSPTTVNVSHYPERALPFVSAAGASQRHVADLADPDRAGGFILPAGQSGNPLSRHYRDHFERYLRGELWRVPLDSTLAHARSVQRLVLVPDGRD